jgi:hypothetical protein
MKIATNDIDLSATNIGDFDTPANTVTRVPCGPRTEQQTGPARETRRGPAGFCPRDPAGTHPGIPCGLIGAGPGRDTQSGAVRASQSGTVRAILSRTRAGFPLGLTLTGPVQNLLKLHFTETSLVHPNWICSHKLAKYEGTKARSMT